MSEPNGKDPNSGAQDPEQAVPDDADPMMVVADLDSTLLDGEARIPSRLWPLLERMREFGMLFVPASGRPLATIHSMFERAERGMPFIAENGGYVVRDGRTIAASTFDHRFVATVIERVRGLVADGADLGLVLSGKNSAHIERHDEVFLDQARIYYVALSVVDDLLTVPDDIVKLSIYDFGDPEHSTKSRVDSFAEGNQVVLAGKHWVDIMSAGVNKGVAVRSLQEALGIGREQTAAFGDYFNDIEMLDAAELSFAVANAHPEVKKHARAVVPANTEGGVITTLERLLEVRERSVRALRPAQR